MRHVTAIIAASIAAQVFAQEPVTVDNFIRAETDSAFRRTLAQGEIGAFTHRRAPTPINAQHIVRMNRDTLYSVAVFDLTQPVTIVMPNPDERFQSLHIIDQDHYTVTVEHGAGRYTLTRDDVETRYVAAIVRLFIDANDRRDIAEAHALQDAIRVEQTDAGQFEAPDWDRESMARIRGQLKQLAATLTSIEGMFGARGEVDPVRHLLGTASGWGGNPVEAAWYQSVMPEDNDGSVAHALTLRDVPADGFWSVTVYNAEGFMETNAREAYAFNSATSEVDADGSVTIHFGECEDGRSNCLPVMPGWSYVLRLYQPQPSVLDGSWAPPEPRPVRR
ncbi:MAG: DUF1214 domain-containing protein [Pseudomonadota bacterium]